ncbi:unnamed protein product [Miscanthus lutarioriparius]|uniref:Uncharacterized protein n=1 Tax=Miscanthus lutarioriparius TaxID=422564 RepID=A0A811RDJ9_9POAL|nr:unnamed protein product [Miscanthus lutarioriparius]
MVVSQVPERAWRCLGAEQPASALPMAPWEVVLLTSSWLSYSSGPLDGGSSPSDSLQASLDIDDAKSAGCRAARRHAAFVDIGSTRHGWREQDVGAS